MDNYLELSYYYGKEGEQFSFFRIPRLLVKDERYKRLSADAKILYGLMLDRMSLSRKNGWLDEQGRVYIYYKVEEAMEDIGCSRGTIIKIMAELDSKKGIGLIEKKRQGLGKPDIIYVKNFATVYDEEGEETEKEAITPEKSVEVQNMDFSNSDTCTSEGTDSESQEIQDMYPQKSNNHTSDSADSELSEVQKADPNYTDSSYTEASQTQVSYPNPSTPVPPKREMTREERLRALKAWNEGEPPVTYQQLTIRKIRGNVEYPTLLRDNPYDKKRIDEFIRIMSDVICYGSGTFMIGNYNRPAEVVGEQFKKLRREHMQYVLDSFRRSNVPMKAPDVYMIAALYNSYNTVDNELAQRVNYDLSRDDFSQDMFGGVRNGHGSTLGHYVLK